MNTSSVTKSLTEAYAEVKALEEKKKFNFDKKDDKSDDKAPVTDKEDDGEGMDPVDKKAVKKDFKDREDKDLDNDGDTDSSDKFLHKKRKAITKKIDAKDKDVETEVDEACWDDYEQKGMKDKDGKKVPNCVAKEAKAKPPSIKPLTPEVKSFVNKKKSAKYKTESTGVQKWSVYRRILEKMEAAKGEEIDSKESEGSKAFAAMHHDGQEPEDAVDINKVIDQNKKDMLKGMPKGSLGRSNDNPQGDKVADKPEGKKPA